MTDESNAAFRIREIDRLSAAEREWVARGMHLTLAEVDGAEGARAYPIEWTRQRLASLLDPAEHTAEVFLLVRADDDAAIVGYTILRIDLELLPEPYGLFSTTYVDPPMRRHGLADRLLLRGEAWIRAHALPEAATWTASTNVKLIRLYEKHGYVQTASGMNGTSAMVRMGKAMNDGAAGRERDLRAPD